MPDRAWEKFDTDRVQSSVSLFVKHLGDELPSPPDIDESDPMMANSSSETEYNRLARLGKAAVDEYEKTIETVI